MYGVFTIAFKYLKYFLTSSNGKGHGIHSPFVFEFVTKVLNDKNHYKRYEEIERVREQMLVDKREINVIDFGAGSGMMKSNKRMVSRIAATSLKPKKYAQLLHKLTRHFAPSAILELGTSLGITSAYITSGNPSGKFTTCEGDPSIAAIANDNLRNLQVSNFKVKVGDFKTTLPEALDENPLIDFAFLDGNHKKEPTLQYFQQLLGNINEHSVIVFDDIHWSEEMEEAWDTVKQHQKVTLTIDLFFIGLVFFKTEFHHKQHFVVRF